MITGVVVLLSTASPVINDMCVYPTDVVSLNDSRSCGPLVGTSSLLTVRWSDAVISSVELLRSLAGRSVVSVDSVKRSCVNNSSTCGLLAITLSEVVVMTMRDVTD